MDARFLRDPGALRVVCPSGRETPGELPRQQESDFPALKHRNSVFCLAALVLVGAAGLGLQYPGPSEQAARLTGSVLTVKRGEITPPSLHPKTLVGEIVEVSYGSFSAGLAAEITSFKIVDSTTGATRTVHILNPGPAITQAIENAMAMNCPISVAVTQVGGKTYLVGGAGSITLNCEE